MADYGLIRSYETYGDLTRIVLGTPRAFDFPGACRRLRYTALSASHRASGRRVGGLCIEYTIDPTVNFDHQPGPDTESRRPASSN